MILNIPKQDIPLLMQTINIGINSLDGAIKTLSETAPGGPDTQIQLNKFNDLRVKLYRYRTKLSGANSKELNKLINKPNEVAVIEEATQMPTPSVT